MMAMSLWFLVPAQRIKKTVAKLIFVEKLAEDAFHRIWMAGEAGIELPFYR